MDYIRTHRCGARNRCEFNDPVGRSQVIRKQAVASLVGTGVPVSSPPASGAISALRHGRGNRLESVRVTQQHAGDGTVTLALAPELTRPEPKGGPALAAHPWSAPDRRRCGAASPASSIRQLWWPHGQGAQPLYTLQIEVLRADGSRLGRWWCRRIGLRTIKLDRHADAAAARRFNS